MQINIDKKSGIFIGIIAVLSLGIIFLLAGNSGEPMDHSGHGSMTSDEASSAKYSDDELMFAKIMIPHHEQAVTMSELALKNTSNSEVLALATAIRDAQAPEIEQMQGWLGKEDSHDAHNHDMEMGGMLTAEDLEKLASLRGDAFDQFFLASMIAHHEGALDMIEMIKDSTNAEVKALADNIVKSQSAEIQAIKALLK
jgi:uncharacterized protein (DUF305 family)